MRHADPGPPANWPGLGGAGLQDRIPERYLPWSRLPARPRSSPPSDLLRNLRKCWSVSFWREWAWRDWTFPTAISPVMPNTSPASAPRNRPRGVRSPSWRTCPGPRCASGRSNRSRSFSCLASPSPWRRRKSPAPSSAPQWALSRSPGRCNRAIGSTWTTAWSSWWRSRSRAM